VLHPDQAIDRTIFTGDVVRIGAFRCLADDPRLAESGPRQDFCFVFPRTAVEIHHPGQRPLIVDPSIVTFYNRNQEYRRRAISPEGDRCDWYAIAPDLLRDALREHDPAAAEDERRPLRFAFVPSDPETYLRQRLLFIDVLQGRVPDALYVEEAVVDLLDSVIAHTYGAMRHVPRPLSSRQHDLVDAIKLVLARRFAEPLTIRSLVDQAGGSIFHVCRMFRQLTGMTLHDYRNQLRLRAALEQLTEGDEELTRIAFGTGYAHHSHFTAAFRRAFGTTPSVLRGRARARKTAASLPKK
jgi:AraC family transcriptional regulator